MSKKPVKKEDVKKKIQFDRGSKFLLIILGIFVIISGSMVTPNKAMSLAENQVNSIVSSQGISATANTVVFEHGLYKISLSVGSGSNVQPAEVYLTKDGKQLIIGNVFEIGSSSESVEPETINFELDGTELSLGDSTAPVTVIEFSDFQCPFCRRFYTDTLQELKTNYIDTGKVYFVYKHFPLSFHPIAQKSGEAVECANDQNRWIEMHDKIFEEQDKDGQGTVQYTVDDIKNWAKSVVADSTTFNSCLDSGKYEDKVLNDFQEGQSVGVSGTPASFVNGVMVSGAQPFSVFAQLIDEELNSN